MYLSQGKTVHQAEIDATCESIDFLRFAAHYGAELLKVTRTITSNWQLFIGYSNFKPTGRASISTNSTDFW